ncbi:MAG: universal stress protein [Desulfosarcinaceae bacterium]|nr:universal stress protein [Desulfosarcinaceae bacterium]
MFKKILVPVELDYPKTAALVYQRAADHARLSGAEIHLVTVMPGFSMPIVASVVPDDVVREAEKHVKTLMEDFVAENCDDTVTYKIRTGKNWEEIIKEAERWGADLIIVYHNHRREINEVFSRSCSQRVADHAKCSVLRLRNIRP